MIPAAKRFISKSLGLPAIRPPAGRSAGIEFPEE